MSSKLNQHTLLVFLVFIYFPKSSSSETECTYPCTPSTPTGSESAGAISPPLLTGGSLYPPPAQDGGLIPNSPTPPDRVNSVALPAPDTVVPWYPYYSKRPITYATDQSSSTSFATPTVVIGSPILLVLFFFLSTFAHTLL
ncbi:hypothetical protein POM88_018235 [Heracleum sosnowskyi]|uniref:Uncharacterized protein n=1 Tax=Heracleum sosnowskyi TaxID=360622 RepID=A0AAD8ITB4_9APIA|nr:hypothetical protein POM88_018235 [Heracleum sosnowskyi]